MKYRVDSPNSWTRIEGLLNYSRDLYRGILITVDLIGMSHQPGSRASLAYGPMIAMSLLVDSLELPEQVAEDFLEGKIDFEMDGETAVIDTKGSRWSETTSDHGYIGMLSEEHASFVAQGEEGHVVSGPYPVMYGGAGPLH